ncbi:MAG: DciA family protein [Planctomycetota bacterium]
MELRVDAERRRSTPEPALLSEVLQALIARLAPSAGATAGSTLPELREIWSTTVGREVDRMTRVVSYRRGVLTVEVSSAPLLAELRAFAREDLLVSLSEAGLTGVHSLRFTTSACASVR